MELLYLFEKIRNPFLNFFFGAITYLGDELALMLIAVIILWCVNKRSGYYMLVSGFFGILVNQTMKLACKIPRPAERDPLFTIVESAREAAKGYSFPSGHTQNAVTVFGSIFIKTSKKWLKIICIAIAILVPVSRMYLGVHTLWDVLAAAGCAVIILLLLDEVFVSEERMKRFMPYICLALVLGTVAFFLYACVFSPKSSHPNAVSARDNAMTLLGCAAGLLLVYPLDRYLIKYETRASWYNQIIKLTLGFGLLMLIKVVVKIPLYAWLGDYERPIRYFLMIAFGGAGWPLMFKYINKMKIPSLDKFGERIKKKFAKS